MRQTKKTGSTVLKRRRKRLAALSMACLIAALTLGCSGNSESEQSSASTETSVQQTEPASKAEEGTAADEKDLSFLNMDSDMPIVKEGNEIHLKVLFSASHGYENMKDFENEVYFIKAYEKLNNVKIDWEIVPASDFENQLALVLASGDLPDVIFHASVSNSSQLKYGEEGYFLNLMENDLLENYAPHYYELTQKYPELLTSSMMPDGSLYSMGMVRNDCASVVSKKMYFNQEWLDRLKLEVPTTIDEFTEMLVRFKKDDPNGNGQQDEIGLYCSSDDLQAATFGAFGLANRGMKNEWIDWDNDNQKVQYYAMSDRFRQWVEWAHRLYSEGLLNNEYFDFSTSMLGTHMLNDVCGAFIYTNTNATSEEIQNKLTYLDGALTGPDGDRIWSATNCVGDTGHWIVTTSCQYPEVALRWADYFFTPEGSLLFYYGEEGVTYEKNDDGTYRFTDDVLADYYAETNTYAGCTQKVSLYRGGKTPTMTTYPYNSADDHRGVSLESAKKLVKDCPNAWPNFTFTSEENRVITDIKKDIDDFVNGKRDAWIMGTETLDDASWNSYLKTIEKMGVNDVLDVYETAVQRIKQQGYKDGFHSLDEFEK